MISTQKYAITVAGITQDMQFIGRYISSLQGAPGNISSIPSLGIFSYFSIFIYEADRQMRAADPQSAANLSPETRAILERSRNSLKLFSNKQQGGMDGIIKHLVVIREAQRRTFGGSRYFPLARLWAKDLGLFQYQGHSILTTDAAIFAGGIDPQERVTDPEFGPRLGQIAREYGQYVARWGVTLDASQSFATAMRADAVTMLDKKGRNYFPNSFNGPGTPGLNLALSLFQSLTSFNERLVALDRSPESRPTIFKIRYLLSFELLQSLDAVTSNPTVSLTARSKEAIRSIVNEAGSELVRSRKFRNDLMHYCPDATIDDAKLGSDPVNLFLLPEFYFNGRTLEDIDSELANWSAAVTPIMEVWAAD